MPAIAMQNYMGSSAASDLGLGDQLRQQLEDELEERRKTQQQQVASNGTSGTASSGTNPFQSPAALSLLGGFQQ